MNSKRELLEMIKDGKISAQEALKSFNQSKEKNALIMLSRKCKEKHISRGEVNNNNAIFNCFSLSKKGDFYDYVINSLDGVNLNINQIDSVSGDIIITGEEIINTENNIEYILSNIFDLFKEIVSNIKRKVHIVFLYNKFETNYVYRSLSSFFRILNEESSNLNIVSVEVTNEANSKNKIVEIINSVLLLNGFHDLMYSDGKFYEYVFEKMDNIRCSDVTISDGTTIITGGNGKIARIVVEHILDKYTGHISLIGRSDISSDTQELIRKYSGKIDYHKSDVADEDSLGLVINEIRQMNGRINSIYHCAGVVDDEFFIKKEKKSWNSVIRAKVKGTILLDKFTKNDDLKSFVCFSSVAAIIPSVGQSDYAVANHFMDCYMEYRDNLVDNKLRYGRSISINWPLWKNGGMKLSAAYVDTFRDQYGFIPLKNEYAFEALDHVLQTGVNNIVVLSGDEEKIMDVVNGNNNKIDVKNEVEVSYSTSANDNSELVYKMEEWLKKLLSDVAKIPINRIRKKEPLEKYGIDSLMIIDMNKKIEEKFGKVPKTVFFEYQTIEELAGFFVESHYNTVVELFKTKQFVQLKQNNKILKTSIKDNRIFSNYTTENDNSSIIKDDIAIIGVSGIYPKADNLDQYWERLLEGADCITEIPIDRWDYRKNYEYNTKKINKTYCKWGSFINDVDKFDPLFFNLSPREAELMDPQERLFLETAWNTIEDAGYTPDCLNDTTVGVYVGAMFSQYQMFGAQNALDGEQLVPGSSFASIANRVSYFMNFRGPSIAVDTMCSSSLTSIHLAVESIKRGECQIALAGGVNLILHPHKYRLLCQGGFLSRNGKSMPFGKGEGGYIPGEGVGAVLLKPLSAAERDGDHIYAVIKSSTINHGGKTNGFSVPNPVLQGKLIENAIKQSGVNAEEISYIEAHGTGTLLGDPIEIKGLKNAFDNWTDKKQFCSIGSVKSNLGHLESAAGIAGLTKILLMMKYKKLVPSIHSEVLNENIAFEKTPFYVQQKVSEWNNMLYPEKNRTAAISAFGAGGSNAHIILQEYKDNRIIDNSANNIEIIPFSAKNRKQLKEYLRGFVDFINRRRGGGNCAKYNEEISIDELCRIVADILHVSEEEINEKDDWETLGWERTMTQSLVEKISNKYNVNIDFNSLIDIHTCYDLKHLLVNTKYDGDSVNYKTTSIKNEFNEEISLRDIAYTLLVGRKAMEERIVIKAESINELVDSIELYLSDRKDIANIIEGNQKNSYDNDYFDDDDMSLLIDKWIRNNQYSKICNAWTNGIINDLSGIAANQKGKRISLPHYSFEKNRCWFNDETTIIPENSSYPLICANISDLNEVKFYSVINNKSSFVFENNKNEKRLNPFVLNEIVFEAMGILGLIGDYEINNIYYCESNMHLEEKMELYTYFYNLSDEIKFEVICNDSVLLQGTLNKTIVNNRSLSHENNDINIFEAYNQNYMLPLDIYSKLFDLICDSNENSDIVINKIHNISIKKLNEEYVRLSIIRKDETNNDNISLLVIDDNNNLIASFNNIDYKKIKSNSKSQYKIEVSEKNVEPSYNELEKWLKGVFISKVAKLLKINENDIDIRDNFTTYGFDSISLKEFSDDISEYFSIEILPTQFFDTTNFVDLIRLLISEYYSKIAEKYIMEKNGSFLILENAKSNTLHEKLLTPLRDIYSGRSNNINEYNKEPIAIIGMHGIYPQCHDLQEYWENLYNQNNLITEIPSERWDWHEFYSEKGAESGKHSTGSRWGGFIADFDKFDPRFFNMSPIEASMMDPQHRLYLETVWKTFEDAGYKISDYSGKNVGMFVGVQFNDYQQLLGMQGESNSYMGLGNEHSILINRISYLFNFHGPSEPYNTACSSASVALHRAVRSIREGESEIAVAGGISLMLSPLTMIGADQLGILSPDGKCKTLDKSANGYVKGEGIGAILLKPLSKAIHDNDHIYALIKGTAVNHGGKATSLTAPNKNAQADVLISAYEDANIKPDTVTYLELHGTGTELGDPIEIEGIKKAFNVLAEKKHVNINKGKYCGIGSVKTNIGHLEPASGMAGIMKVVLSMNHQCLPGLINLKEINPYVKLDNTPFYIVDKTCKWERLKDEQGNEIPYRSGVSSFGFGGVNSHVVLEEYIEEEHEEINEKRYVFVLSAKKSDQLKKKAEDLLKFLEKEIEYSNTNFRNIIYTLQVGREDFPERIASVIGNSEELIDFLNDYLNGEVESVHIKDNEAAIVNSPQVEKALSDKDYDLVKWYWMNNYTINWNLLYNKTPFRISLPTYPFARETYWAPKKVTLNNNAEVKQQIDTNNKLISKHDPAQIEDVLKQIIASELHFEKDEILSDESLDKYGIDSITSSNIMRKVQEIYGDQISLYAIIDYNTIVELSKYIEQTSNVEQISNSIQVNKNVVKNKYPNEVVPLNPKGDKITTFWFHGSLGYVQVYYALSKALGSDYPFYAFQAKGIDGISMPFIDIKEMAAYYIKCIKEIQPEGPYCICGYSLGGLIGYEVANQLIQNGDKIFKVIMLDTYPVAEKMLELYFSNFDYAQTSIMIANGYVDLEKEKPITIKDVEDVPEKLQLVKLAQIVKKRSNRAMSVEEIYNSIKGSIDVNMISEQMYRSYIPQKYDSSEVLFFKATQGFVKEDNDMNMKSMDFSTSFDYLEPWKNTIKDLKVIEVPADHLTILEEPSLSIVKNEIIKALDEYKK